MTIYNCKYCSTPFNTRQSESRHRSKTCKSNPEHKDFVRKESDQIQETIIYSKNVVFQPQSKSNIVSTTSVLLNNKKPVPMEIRVIKEERSVSNIICKPKVFLKKKRMISPETIEKSLSVNKEHKSEKIIDITVGDSSSTKNSTSFSEKSDGSPSLENNNVNFEFFEFIKKMHEIQQKSMFDLQKSQQESLSEIASLKKELEEIKEKPSIQNIDNSVNSINFNLDIYFTSKLDLHHLACLQKGEAWANDYFLYAIHRDGKYLDSIINFVVCPDVDKSPIRMGKNNEIEFYRSQNLIDYDHDGHGLERETINLVSRAYLKVFNNTDVIKKLDLLDHNSLRLAEIENSACNHEEYRSVMNGCFIDEESSHIQNIILDGGDGLPPLRDLHKNLAKINKYKIPISDRKHFTKLLPSSMQT